MVVDLQSPARKLAALERVAEAARLLLRDGDCGTWSEAPHGCLVKGRYLHGKGSLEDALLKLDLLYSQKPQSAVSEK